MLGLVGLEEDRKQQECVRRKGGDYFLECAPLCTFRSRRVNRSFRTHRLVLREDQVATRFPIKSYEKELES